MFFYWIFWDYALAEGLRLDWFGNGRCGSFSSFGCLTNFMNLFDFLSNGFGFFQNKLLYLNWFLLIFLFNSRFFNHHGVYWRVRCIYLATGIRCPVFLTLLQLSWRLIIWNLYHHLFRNYLFIFLKFITSTFLPVVRQSINSW